MPPFDVVGIGENSVDLVYRLPGAPEANAKLAVSAHHISSGGQVATTLATCASLGLHTAYVGSLGNDENGGRILQALTDAHVDVSAAVVREAPNRHAVILVNERNGDRTVLWHRDPRLALAVDDVPRALIQSARLLHVDDLDEEPVIAAAGMARDAGIPVTADIDRVTPRTREIIAAVTVPILSAHVPSALTGERDAERALRALAGDHPGWLCVTLGTRGAMLLEDGRLHRVPAFKVRATDTTGAGDVFRGAFIYALLRGDTPADILRFAAAAAAVACTKEGALASVPTLAAVQSMLRSGDLFP